jgi:peptide chain release factor 1
MLDRLNFIENKYEELSRKISDPSVMADQKEWQRLCKEHADLETVVNKYKEYKKTVEDIEANKEMLNDDIDKEFKETVQEELKTLTQSEEDLQKELRILLLPKDPNDEKNVFIEIRRRWWR